jgi:hypothetical protein
LLRHFIFLHQLLNYFHLVCVWQYEVSYCKARVKANYKYQVYDHVEESDETMEVRIGMHRTNINVDCVNCVQRV